MNSNGSNGAILELPEVRQQFARLSVANFHRVAELGIYDKRDMLIRGIVIKKMSGSPLHRRLEIQLYERLRDLRPMGYAVFMESDLLLSDSSVIPDVMVCAGEQSDYDDRHPSTAELVIEVAVSSEALDREMAGLYAEAGVRESWIVLASRRQVEVYRRPENGEYRERRLYAENEELVCAALPAVRFALPELFG